MEQEGKAAEAIADASVTLQACNMLWRELERFSGALEGMRYA